MWPSSPCLLYTSVIGDWEHPYLTMNPGFEAEEVKVFGAMYKKGMNMTFDIPMEKHRKLI